MFNLDTIVEAHLQQEHHALFSTRPRKRQKTSGKLSPILRIRFQEKHGTPKYSYVKALCDSGSSESLIEQKFAQKLRSRETPKERWNTAAGTFTTNRRAKINMQLIDLSDTLTITGNLHLCEKISPRYDMVLGRNILSELGIVLDFAKGLIHMGNAQIPMTDVDNLPLNPKDGKFDGEAVPVQESYFATNIQEPPLAADAVAHVSQILDAKYALVDPMAIVELCTHLDEMQRVDLMEVLCKHVDLFDGSLGKWKGIQHRLELKDPNSPPFVCKPYPVPVKNKATLMLELDHLCSLGVLRKVNNSEYQSPSTIIPKKDQTVRFITDFRKLNKLIKRKPFPLPNIRETLLELEGFQWGTSLDLNMGYYHIELHPDSRKYCTIVFPFGKYEYLRLPMGLCNSPDIFQEHMSDLMHDLEYVRAYIDDVAILTKGTWAEHLEKVDIVLTRLGDAGLKVNGLKSFFGRKEFEYLGYVLTPEGVKPIESKVQKILDIAPPKNIKQLRSFLGMVNYYRDMWIRRSHILAPLNALNKKGRKWTWGETEQKAFDDIKRVMSKETLLHYPDFNKTFEIHTDASNYQLGAVITQDNKPIAFYSRRLRDGQHNYTTTERELLAIVETLKEFRTILLGQKIKIFTDHKNLTFSQFNTERVMRWRMVLEEYGPELVYIKGHDNVVADALSRLDLLTEPDPIENTDVKLHDFTNIYRDELPDDAYPLRMSLISAEQDKDTPLQERANKPNSGFTRKRVRGGRTSFNLLHLNDKIYVPASLRKRILTWYHDVLMHPGMTRMLKTIQMHFTWPKLRDEVERFCKRCNTCQLTKKTKKKYGHLPAKEAEAEPWDTLCIDLIGPYIIKDDMKDRFTLHCLTMIDPATGWFEIAEIPSKRADDVANVLERTWLSRYPWPQHVINDRGSEFMAEVQEMLTNDYGCDVNRITTRNPQANAIVERVHQTIGNMIRTWLVNDPDLNEKEPFVGLLSAVAFATRATVHTTLNASPSQLVFGRDAVLNMDFHADWQIIKSRKQKRINANNVAENAKRIDHNYQVNDRILIKNDPSRKFGTNAYSGPYRVTEVRNNGTLRYQNGNIYDTINIRNVTPYHDAEANDA